MKSILIFFLLGPSILLSQELRLKDLVRVRGKRENDLVGGLGLVVGLSGTGDSPQAISTQKTVRKMFQSLGMNLNEDAINTRNMALVSVTGKLPEFARLGDQFDVSLASLGDSTSLKGGQLLFAELKGPDHFVYATVQGFVHQPGFLSLEENATTGLTLKATVEREYPTSLIKDGSVRFSLKNPDFTTAKRVVQRINSHLKGFFAKALDSRTIDIRVPDEYGSELSSQLVEFISDLEQLTVQTDQASTVVISRKSKTITFGGRSEVSPVLLSHAHFDLEIKPSEKARPVLEDVARGLQRMGATSDDLISVIRALQASGAINTQLKIID
jgi:flagellar P-ring protein precursor FlgI